MNEAEDTVEDRVATIFRELVGDGADQLTVGIPSAQQIAHKALAHEFDDKRAFDIAFHLTDWNSDAAFIVALLLFPERFTPDEIRDGIEDFLIHAPNHVAAAAKLRGYPVEDIFQIDALNQNNRNT